MSLLSERQRLELHKLVVQYLQEILPELGATLQHQLGVTEDQLLLVPPRYLEKKWSTVVRLQKRILELENRVEQLSAHPLAALGDLQLWLPSSSWHTLRGPPDAVTSVAVHPYLPQVVCGCSDGTMVVWDLQQPAAPVRVVAAHTRQMTSVTFTREAVLVLPGSRPQVHAITCGADLMVKVWDALYTCVRTMAGHDHLVSCVAVSTTLPLHVYLCSRDRSIKLWDLTTGFCVKSFVGHSEWVRGIAVCGEYVLSASSDQSIRLSHGPSGAGLALAVGHNQVVETCVFLPTALNQFLDPYSEDDAIAAKVYEQTGFKYAASGGRDNTVRVWLLPPPVLRPHHAPSPSSNPSARCVLELKGHASWVRLLAVHPLGRYLFLASDDKTIAVWDLLEHGARVRELLGHQGFVLSMALADRGNESACVFVSGSVDTTVQVWQ